MAGMWGLLFWKRDGLTVVDNTVCFPSNRGRWVGGWVNEHEKFYDEGAKKFRFPFAEDSVCILQSSHSFQKPAVNDTAWTVLLGYVVTHRIYQSLWDMSFGN